MTVYANPPIYGPYGGRAGTLSGTAPNGDSVIGRYAANGSGTAGRISGTQYLEGGGVRQAGAVGAVGYGGAAGFRNTQTGLSHGVAYIPGVGAASGFKNSSTGNYGGWVYSPSSGLDYSYTINGVNYAG